MKGLIKKTCKYRLSLSQEQKKKKILTKNKFYTFSPDTNNKQYSLFDGKKLVHFSTCQAFFNHLLQEKEKNKKLTLFGYNVCNISILSPLLQEAWSRGYHPSVNGGELISSCYLKGRSIIIKDAKNFFLEKTADLKQLYQTIKHLDYLTQKKHQVSIINQVSTIAKISWLDFWQTNREEQKKYGWDKIWNLNQEEDKFIRQAFRGGYLDLFNEQNYQGTVSDWDFKNFYPSLMARYPFPTSRPEWVNHPKEFYGSQWKKNFYGFYECQVECLPNNPYPFLTHKDEADLHAYRPGKYNLVLFSEEIKFFWQHTPLIKISVGSGYAYRTRHYIFRNWVRKLYHGQEKGDQLAKLKMVSLFGAFGRQKEQHYWTWTKERVEARSGEFTAKNKQKVYLLFSENPKSTWKFTNVGIAAAITAYGRITLYQALLSNWNNVLYCATDGFVLKGKENKHQSKPIFAQCGCLEKKGEYEGFISLAPNVYAFYDKNGNLVDKRYQDLDEKKKYLFSKQITQENKKEIWDQIPNRHQGGIALNQMLTEIVEQKKKQLVGGKWRIWAG